ERGKAGAEDRRDGRTQRAEALGRDHVELLWPPDRYGIHAQPEVVEAERLDEGQIRWRDVGRQVFLRVPSRVHHLREPVARVDAALQRGEPCVQAARLGQGFGCRAARSACLCFGHAAGVQLDQDDAESETQCEAKRFRWHGWALPWVELPAVA